MLHIDLSPLLCYNTYTGNVSVNSFAEEYQSGITDQYYDLNSDIVQEQILYHGKNKIRWEDFPMKINKKKILVIAITVIVTFTITLIGVYWYTHPTHYLYEDRWIIGQNADQIEQRYGSYDYNSETIHGSLIKGYCVKPSTTDWWGDATWPEYYMVYFDENGKAYKVEIVVGGWGG